MAGKDTCPASLAVGAAGETGHEGNGRGEAPQANYTRVNGHGEGNPIEAGSQPESGTCGSECMETALGICRQLHDNPLAWARLCAAAAEAVAHGTRLSMGAQLEAMRHHDAVGDSGEAFKVCNDCAPVWGRLLLQLYPELAPLMEQRQSRFDRLDWEYLLGVVRNV